MWGYRYGPDRCEAYTGDPTSEKGGCGCFAPVIAKALQKCLISWEWRGQNFSGYTLDELFAGVVMGQQTLVSVWVTIGMEKINTVYQWQSYDKFTT